MSEKIIKRYGLEFKINEFPSFLEATVFKDGDCVGWIHYMNDWLDVMSEPDWDGVFLFYGEVPANKNKIYRIAAAHIKAYIYRDLLENTP